MTKIKKRSDKEIEEPFSTAKDIRRLFNAVFSKEVMQSISTKEITSYYKSIVKSCKKLEATRFPLNHFNIQQIVGWCLSDMKWNVRWETPFAYFDYNYRFDLMAKKDKKTIIVEVKPFIDEKSLGQILGYMLRAKKEIKTTRIFLAMDILNLHQIFNNGTVTEIISEFAKKYGMGVMLVDQDNDGNWECGYYQQSF